MTLEEPQIRKCKLFTKRVDYCRNETGHGRLFVLTRTIGTKPDPEYQLQWQNPDHF